MEDGKITIKTEIDTSEVEKGLGNVKKNLDAVKKPVDTAKKSTDNLNKSLKDAGKATKETAKETKTLSGGMKDFASSALLPIASVAGAVEAFKKLVVGMREANLAYRAQSDSETMLALAIRNNPYVTGEAETRLKSYAKQMQAVTAVSDNEILESMQKLITNGRTEAEVFDIIGAGLNLAVKEGISLDSATDQLNATFSGMAGTLGRHNSAIKNLTQEQLKNGEAVKLVSQALDGYAEATANADAKTAQAKKTLQESLGKVFEPTFTLLDEVMERFYTRASETVQKFGDFLDKNSKTLKTTVDVVNSMYASGEGVKLIDTDALKEAERLLKIKQEANNLERISLAEQTQVTIDRLKKDLEDSKKILKEKQYEKYEKETLKDINYLEEKRLEQLYTAYSKITAKEEQALIFIQEELSIRKKIEKEKKEEEARLKEIEEQEALKLQQEKDLLSYIEANTKARERALLSLEEKARLTGEEVSNAEKLAVYQNSYVDLIANSDGRITHQSKEAKKLLSTTQELYEQELKRLTADEKKQKIIEDTQELERLFASVLPELESQRLKKQLDELETFYNKTIALLTDNVEERKRLEEEFAKTKIFLAEKIAEAEEKENAIVIKSWQEKASDILDIASSFMSEYTSMMSAITALAQKGIDSRVAREQQELDEKYQQGLISAENYEDELLKLDKEARQEKYKMDMWEWGVNLANSIVNTAVAFTKALTAGPILGPVLAGLIATAGAAQAALIGANKPQPPAFAQGGFVPGNPRAGDVVDIKATGGEFIANRAQQRRLYDLATGKERLAGARINIYNKASNEIKAQPQITEDGINFVVEKIVTKQMAEGKYNNAFRAMQNSLQGRLYQ